MPDIISSILPDKEVSILAGASGAGKTTLIMQALAAMQQGKEVFGHECQPGLRLGYIAADRSWRSYQRTAELSSLDLGSIKVRALIDDPAIDLANFEKSPLDELERLIASMLPLDLVAVDPLVVFLGVDTNKYHLSAARLIRLNKACLANNITILGTHHATKARSDYSFKRPQDRISGTSALLGFTSSQLFLAAPEETSREDGFYEFHVISHHAAPKVILLSREGGRFRHEGTEETSYVSTSPTNQLMNLLKNGPLKREDILSSVSGSRATIDRLLASALAAKVIERGQYGHYGLVGAFES